MSTLSTSPSWFTWNSQMVRFSGARIHIVTQETEHYYVATLMLHPLDGRLYCLRLQNPQSMHFMPSHFIKFIRRSGSPGSCFMLDLRALNEADSPMFAA